MKKITDKMRLDWLARKDWVSLGRGSSVYRYVETSSDNGDEHTGRGLRQAIDAAIRATPPRPKTCEKEK